MCARTTKQPSQDATRSTETYHTIAHETSQCASGSDGCSRRAESTAPNVPLLSAVVAVSRPSSGVDLPLGMRGEEKLDTETVGRSKKRDREEPAAAAAGTGTGGEQKAAAAAAAKGLQQIEGVVQNLSELRRRSRKAAKKGTDTAPPAAPASSAPAPAAPAPAAPAAGEEALAHSGSGSGGGTIAEGAL